MTFILQISAIIQLIMDAKAELIPNIAIITKTIYSVEQKMSRLESEGKTVIILSLETEKGTEMEIAGLIAVADTLKNPHLQ